MYPRVSIGAVSQLINQMPMGVNTIRKMNTYARNMKLKVVTNEKGEASGAVLTIRW
jgi:hypothetical protein